MRGGSQRSKEHAHFCWKMRGKVSKMFNFGDFCAFLPSFCAFFGDFLQIVSPYLLKRSNNLAEGGCSSSERRS